MSRSPSPIGKHSALVARLIVELANAMEASDCDAVVLTELDWIVSDITVVRPDVLVTCDGPPNEHLQTPPTLVAEVLSTTTRERDLTFKRDLYQQEGVGNYLTVDPNTDKLLWFGDGAPQGWSGDVVTERMLLSICEDCSITFHPPRLFRR